MPTPRDRADNTIGLLILATCGLVGVWLGGKVLERLLEKMGAAIEQVAVATGSAIGGGVGMAYAPMDGPDREVGEYRLADAEGEALDHAYDMTYAYINAPEEETRIAVVPPGGSIIPGDTP